MRTELKAACQQKRLSTKVDYGKPEPPSPPSRRCRLRLKLRAIEIGELSNLELIATKWISLFINVEDDVKMRMLKHVYARGFGSRVRHGLARKLKRHGRRTAHKRA